MLNPLKNATDGYLKRQTKAVLVIAVAGWLNFTLSSDVSGSGFLLKKHEYSRVNDIDEVIREDAELILLFQIFLQCRRKV